MQKNILLVIISSIALYSTCLGTETFLEDSFKTIREKLQKNKKAHYSKNGFDKTINITECVNFFPGLYTGTKGDDTRDTSSYTHIICSIALRDNKTRLLVTLITKNFVEGILESEEASETITFTKPLVHARTINQDSTPQEIFAFFNQAQKDLLSKWF